MTYRVTFYADEFGNIYPASQTDQAGCRDPNNRTYAGRPVECAGSWHANQQQYRPFQEAIAVAARRAFARTDPVTRLAQIVGGAQ